MRYLSPSQMQRGQGAPTYSHGAGLMRKLPILTFWAAVLVANPSGGQQLRAITSGPITVDTRTIATGLRSPLEFVSADDGSGRLFIVEQGGRILILKNGGILPTPFLDNSAQIKSGGEAGLLGLAFHPGFGSSASPGFRKFYTYQTEEPTGTADFTVPKSTAFANQSVITEWQASAANSDVADPAKRRDVMRIDHPQGNHNGGKIAFRASDGYLYIATGDGGAGNDVGDGHTPDIGNAQDTSTVLGKILRIDPLAPSLTPGSSDNASGNGSYRVPDDNPFVGSAGLDEIFAYGLRNPFRFSFDATNDRLIVGDVGQNAVEEVDIVERGKNYGWHRREGSFLFNPANGSISPDPNPNPAFTNPVLEYGHKYGVSVIGGYVYRGARVPALTGKYVFGDFRSPATGGGRLFYSDLASRRIKNLGLSDKGQIADAFIKSFGEDSAGELYTVADSGGSTGGKILKIVPIPVAPALVNLSTRARVGVGENTMIAGFILTGSAPKTIVLRGLGPSLTANGQPIPGRLSNPKLSVFDNTGALLAANDDWGTSPKRQQIVDKQLAPSDSRESATLLSLQPGAYTAVLNGVGGESGIGRRTLRCATGRARERGQYFHARSRADGRQCDDRRLYRRRGAAAAVDGACDRPLAGRSRSSRPIA